MSFDVGALVKARGREWVVLPESNEDENMLILRPLGGTEDEITGIYLPLEADDVRSAEFPLPDPAADMGNQLSCGLLRDAVRLGFRSGAGPFRSLARIAVEPRPYQLVPLLMALKLDPVRMLIADDVGIGKTIEACLVARELIDRAEVRGLAVLCPPHLAEQWQKALDSQFHIESRLSSFWPVLQHGWRRTAAAMSRSSSDTPSPWSLPTTSRVSAAATSSCAPAPSSSSSTRRIPVRPPRAEEREPEAPRAAPEALVDPEKEEGAARHLLLVTATPHSGKEESFRSLLSLLDHKFDGFARGPDWRQESPPSRGSRQALGSAKAFELEGVSRHGHTLSREGDRRRSLLAEAEVPGLPRQGPGLLPRDRPRRDDRQAPAASSLVVRPGASASASRQAPLPRPPPCETARRAPRARRWSR